MNTDKQYKLLKLYPSLPFNWEVGMILGQGDRGSRGSYSPCNGKYTDWYIQQDDVEKNPDYFTEVLPVSEPVKERVTVSIGSCAENYKFNNKTSFNTVFQTNIPITSELSPKVQQAIEKVLNNDTVVEDRQFIPFNKIMVDKDEWDKRRYSQSEVDTIRKELEDIIEVQKAMLQLQSKQPTNDTGKEDIRDNKINLLEEDLECVHLYLDDINIPRKDDKGQVYSIVGRIKELGMKWMMKISEIESEYLSKQQPTNDNTFVWTDELVLLLCDLCHHNGWHKFGKKVVEIFDEFKSVSSKKWVFPSWIKEHLQSKQSPPLSEIKEGKGWEIVSFKHSSTENYFNINDRGKYASEIFPDEEFNIDLLLNNPNGKTYNIFSVRRLTDNVVFVDGDRYFVNGDYYTIQRFTISDTRIMVKFNGINIPCDISEIPTQPGSFIWVDIDAIPRMNPVSKLK